MSKEKKEKKERPGKEASELNENELEQVTGGTIEIPVVATDKKGDVIVFKIDAPAVEEADVVELNIAKATMAR